jgi:hypothetical protein
MGGFLFKARADKNHFGTQTSNNYPVFQQGIDNKKSPRFNTKASLQYMRKIEAVGGGVEPPRGS